MLRRAALNALVRLEATAAASQVRSASAFRVQALFKFVCTEVLGSQLPGE